MDSTEEKKNTPNYLLFVTSNKYACYHINMANILTKFTFEDDKNLMTHKEALSEMK